MFFHRSCKSKSIGRIPSASGQLSIIGIICGASGGSPVQYWCIPNGCSENINSAEKTVDSFIGAGVRLSGSSSYMSAAI